MAATRIALLKTGVITDLGTIALLVAYVLATAGAVKFLFFGRVPTPKWQIVVPILALILVLYTIYKNAVGLDAPYSWFPYMVAAWLLIGLGITFRRGLTDRVRENLARASVSDSAESSASPESGTPSAVPVDE